MPVGLSSLLAAGAGPDATSLAVPHPAVGSRAPLASHFWSAGHAHPTAAAAAAQAAGNAANAATAVVRTAFARSATSVEHHSASGAEVHLSQPMTRLPSKKDSGSSFLGVPFLGPAKENDNFEWRKRHNYSLDRGAKFGVVYKSPLILDSDLFDLESFGCHESRGFQGLGSGKFMKTLKGDYGKEWWHHPEFTFGTVVDRIGVKLQDQTTGEVKWDAVYELPENSNFLMRDDKPVGGSHPFFQPDWCPPPSGAMAHKYLLTIKNLGELPEPGLEDIGSMMFMQYNPTTLAHTYMYENDAPPEPGNDVVTA